MRKHLLIIFFLFQMVQLYAQTLYVEYEHVVNVVKEIGSFKSNAVLIADKGLSHYTMFFNQEKFRNIPKVTQDENEDSTIQVFSFVDGGDTSTLIYNKDENTISQRFLDKGKPIVIIDNGVDFDWQLTEDTKTIHDFKCTKATLNFRGRQFVAWFTSDIPVSFGPWKFHGLPGLILEVYDIDDLFSWSATLIQYPVKLDKNLEKFDDDQNLRTISLRTYLEEQTESRRDQEKMLYSKLPKGSHAVESKTENKGIELVYEWELEKNRKN